jgi:hypothetical protein
MRMVRFCRSTWLVLIFVLSGLPLITVGFAVVAGAPVDLDQLRVVDVVTERGIDRVQVRPVAVRGQLDAMREPASDVLHKGPSIFKVAGANAVADRKLCVRIEGYPRPDVAPPLLGVLDGDVALLRADERPNLVHLHLLTGKVAHGAVLVDAASLAQVDQQLDDGVLRHASHADGGADAVALDQAADDLLPLLCRQAIHTDYHT